MFWTQWSTEEWIVNITTIIFLGLLICSCWYDINNNDMEM